MKAWVAARQAKDFSKFAPVLQEWVDLIRERSKYIDSGKPCYDVALQDFEKGMSTARLDEIFQEVSIISQLSSCVFCLVFSSSHYKTSPQKSKYSLGGYCLLNHSECFTISEFLTNM